MVERLSNRFTKKLPLPLSVSESSPHMPSITAAAAAATTPSDTVKNAAHNAPCIHPVPVIADNCGVPLPIRSVSLPSVTTSSFPLASTTAPYLAASVLAADTISFISKEPSASTPDEL